MSLCEKSTVVLLVHAWDFLGRPLGERQLDVRSTANFFPLYSSTGEVGQAKQFILANTEFSRH